MASQKVVIVRNALYALGVMLVAFHEAGSAFAADVVDQWPNLRIILAADEAITTGGKSAPAPDSSGDSRTALLGLVNEIGAKAGVTPDQAARYEALALSASESPGVLMHVAIFLDAPDGSWVLAQSFRAISEYTAYAKQDVLPLSLAFERACRLDMGWRGDPQRINRTTATVAIGHRLAAVLGIAELPVNSPISNVALLDEPKQWCQQLLLASLKIKENHEWRSLILSSALAIAPTEAAHPSNDR